MTGARGGESPGFIRGEEVKVPVKGQVWESPGGMQFKVTGVTKKCVRVTVQRTYRDKDGRMVARENEREVPPDLFRFFSLAYTVLEEGK